MFIRWQKNAHYPCCVQSDATVNTASGMDALRSSRLADKMGVVVGLSIESGFPNPVVGSKRRKPGKRKKKKGQKSWLDHLTHDTHEYTAMATS